MASIGCQDLDREKIKIDSRWETYKINKRPWVGSEQTIKRRNCLFLSECLADRFILWLEMVLYSLPQQKL